MRPILLLGAGFSRNWGGFLGAEVFEYLLGCAEMRTDPYLRGLLWKYRREGFEYAIAELQTAYDRDKEKFSGPLRNFQAAVSAMFKDMNMVFAKTRFEFSQTSIGASITHFLSRFDAIFTLNQDLLLESHYMGCNFANGEHYRKWSAQEPPGLRPALGQSGEGYLRWLHSTWQPVPESEFALNPEIQPIVKLHGSSNWTTADGSELLVMGGGKEATISKHEILKWYGQIFVRALQQPGARLMIIGYGFRDHHINRTIVEGAHKHGLQLFVIDPSGSEVAASLRSQVHPGAAQTAYGYDMDSVFERSLMGASRRGLAEIFGGDSLEHTKVMRFFS